MYQVKWILVCSMFLMSLSCNNGEKNQSTSSQKVIHGIVASEYPYVVQIFMGSSSMCTGSFVSDSLLVTAAHCVDRASSVTWNGITVTRQHIFIHDGWPTVSSGCDQSRHPKFDLAMVQFPKRTFKGVEFARILERRPTEGELITIVGFGNSQIQPYSEYCTMPSYPREDGQCYVFNGVWQESKEYQYTAVFNFQPTDTANAETCVAPCGVAGLRSALDASGIAARDFVMDYCGGNFRDRSYSETGAGVKRSGTNRILRLEDDLIQFNAPILTDSAVMESVSGAGDSGGPLLVQDRGFTRLAGITHGGSLQRQEQGLSKWSVYMDITAEHSLDWIQETVDKHALDFPGF
ncbi:MAG: trypsin-like serine protease [Oligoflexus sp.]